MRYRPIFPSFRLPDPVSIFLVSLLAFSTAVQARVLSPLLSGKAAMADRNPPSGKANVNGQDGTRYIPLIIKLADSGAELPGEVVELYRRDDLVLAYVPEKLIGSVAETGVASRIEGGQMCVPTLDEALRFTGYPEIAAASELPEVYTGKGVVVGFSDIGFDPNHIAFLDPNTGQSRVRLLTDYGVSPEEIVRLDTPGEIAAWTTDDPDQWHATHVAGILAGGYQGNACHGIATEADIVATTSDLYDALLLAGMEDVAGYARDQGKPAVINMSVSASLGPHDGTSLFCRYLEKLSEEATICISAGNDGQRDGIWNGVFTEDASTAAAVIDYNTWSPAEAEGYIDVWSQDESVFSFAVIVLDLDTDKVVAREEFPAITSADPELSFAIGSSVEALASIGADESNGRVSGDFSRYLNGVVALVTETNPGNNRFNGLFYLDVENLPEENGELSWRYVVGLEVSGKKGQRMTGYTSQQLRYRSVPEYPRYIVNFGRDGVINDFITGKGVIGVGAMCSRNTWPLLNGEEGQGDCQTGDIASFSSYSSGGVSGILPDIVAPGAWLVSSTSSPYMESHPDEIPATSMEIKSGGKSYYWKGTCGTSMSSPYVAGICALCLQANPSATSAEIKEAIISTATTPAMSPGDPGWGKGILDSYGSLKQILSGAGLDAAPDADWNRTSRGSTLPPLPTPLTPASIARYAVENSCGVFTPDGRKIPASSLCHGIYILRGNGTAVKVAL